HRGKHGERSKIDWRFCRYTVGQLDLANVNRIANVQRGNVHRNVVRQIAWQTFHRQRAQVLFKQAAKIFDAICGAGCFEWDIGLDFLVHRNSMEIDVQYITAHRGMLNFLDHRHARALLAGDLEFYQNVFPRRMTEHHVDVATRDLQRLRLILAAVDNGWNYSASLQLAHRRAAGRLAALRCQFYLLSHT